MGDGDGWVQCAQGHRHWGRFGAAGLLLWRPGTSIDGSADPDGEVVLQHRAPRTHEGDTWGVPGGARDSHEDAVDAALREAGEEAAISPAQVAPRAVLHVDHGGWGYTTVAADAIGPVRPYATNFESLEVRWWPVDRVGTLSLHPGLADAWPRLRATPPRPTLTVDAANVVGSRPDGWWRDRAGATRRLRADLVRLARAGLPAADVIDAPDLDTPTVDVLFPRVVLVVEGAARVVADDSGGTDWPERAVTVRAAPGEGDATIVEVAEQAQVSQNTEAGDGTVLVITADRGLRARLPAGVRAEGPRWLLDRLPDPS